MHFKSGKTTSRYSFEEISDLFMVDTNVYVIIEHGGEYQQVYSVIFQLKIAGDFLQSVPIISSGYKIDFADKEFNDGVFIARSERGYMDSTYLKYNENNQTINYSYIINPIRVKYYNIKQSRYPAEG